MRKLLASVALAAALVAPQGVRAAEEEAKPNTGALSLSGGVDYVTAYIFRGFEYQDAGLIYQPYAQLNIAAYSKDDFSITPYVGLWNSIHERSEPGDGNWWEEDVYGGVDVKVGSWTIGGIYTFYTYPNNAAEEVQEAGLKLSYDDTALAEKVGLPVALNPYVGWYIETSDGNTSDTALQYAEVGINPSFELKGTPISFNFPIAAGFSMHDYYFNDSGSNQPFGFVSAGAYATVALPVPAKFGSWSLYGGATYYYLNADSLQTFEEKSRDYEVAGKAGITFAY